MLSWVRTEDPGNQAAADRGVLSVAAFLFTFV